MQSNQNIALKIRKLLVVNSVMSLKQLRSELNDRPRSSLYRDLKTLNLISSFTHTGHLTKTDSGFFRRLDFLSTEH